MELVLIKKDSPEWNWMWDTITSHPINQELSADMINLWQYKGSLRLRNRILHQFSLNDKSIVLGASKTFNDEDIDKVINIK